jgi:hypothetical protein
MSLVGSLEDLGLGDILQIVSLSRKSGLLVLRADAGEGRIVLSEGQVRAAFVKGEPEDLQSLLVGGGFVPAAAFQSARQRARDKGTSLVEALASGAGLGAERIDSLRREHVERSVLRMFGWRAGQFSFEVRDEPEARDLELALPTGINAQYLAIEASRLHDERKTTPFGVDSARARDAAPDELDEEDPVFSGDPADAAEPEPRPARAQPLASAREALALATARGIEAKAREAAPVGAGAKERAAATGSCLIVIDPDLHALEWVKSALSGRFERIHIFQRSDAGVSRIRQYLARAERPVVLFSTRAAGDPLSGAGDVVEVVRRLKAVAPQLPILWLKDRGAEPPSGGGSADGVVARPPVRRLADRAGWVELEAEAASLRQQLAPWLEAEAGAPRAAGRPAARTAAAAAPRTSLLRLQEISARLHDPTTRGEVLSIVLDFAASIFSRVAMFMLRDEIAVGIAQAGLERAGGPGDAEVRRLRIRAADSAWFRAAVESGEAVQAAPSDAGDQRLLTLLGKGIPKRAYVAPIHSGGRVVALLYADDLPEGGPLPDTTPLATLLHEAGLALDRALLERALAESGGR